MLVHLKYYWVYLIFSWRWMDSSRKHIDTNITYKTEWATLSEEIFIAYCVLMFIFNPASLFKDNWWKCLWVEKYIVLGPIRGNWDFNKNNLFEEHIYLLITVHRKPYQSFTKENIYKVNDKSFEHLGEQ